jgi:hypothetical protein
MSLEESGKGSGGVEPEVEQIPTAEMERMMKIQEVILKAMAGN